MLIRAIQSMYFKKELKTLLKIGVFQPNLFHILDEEGLILVRGRLNKSKTPTYDTQNPIILPNLDGEAVQSLIRHYHLFSILLIRSERSTLYLETLLKKEKWQTATPHLEIGDLVVVKKTIIPCRRLKMV